MKQDELLKAVKTFVGNTPEKPHNIKMLTFVVMGHGNQDGWFNKNTVSEFFINDYLRIETSDGKSIRLLEILKSILVSPKFRGIPKLVICQFCRGNFMNSAAMTDGQQMTDRVNGQERFTRKFLKDDSLKLLRDRPPEFFKKKILPTRV